VIRVSDPVHSGDSECSRNSTEDYTTSQEFAEKVMKNVDSIIQEIKIKKK
jgi:hypothetical protein